MKKQLTTAVLLTSLFLSAPAFAGTFNLVTAPFKPFTNPDHEKGGFLVEVARQALKLRGHEMTITYRPWARALAEASQGKYDGLLSAFYNDERAKSFHFSAPLNTTKMVFVGLKEQFKSKQYSSLNELSPYLIGVGRKWAYSKEFESHTGLTKVTVNDEPKGIQLLFHKRIELFAVNVDQYHSAITKLDQFNVNQSVILEPAISTNDQHIAASRVLPNSEKFLSEFNTGLAALKANGGYNKIRNGFFGF
ncbi:putative ABC transporter, periplasmic amino acid-binding protein [Candidatus Terasakiella magnetica]|uniref:Putative ABC transporter, periplasmic amino acid-binding protein n=1 Tax=Candidatus Terasakiella magnetica TaxID=1867952 RepID=A0A1C3RES5_9PROT|nr:transporter substrate-binding domain-containing protein [Candidatus Terasakiella magnetica]SCA55748.1 putative ABC transporter, periplasmic amino acid-binding protein [Candidatus Terasakiella magnetica]